MASPDLPRFTGTTPTVRTPATAATRRGPTLTGAFKRLAMSENACREAATEDLEGGNGHLRPIPGRAPEMPPARLRGTRADDRHDRPVGKHNPLPDCPTLAP